jgi:di/tricarboxylate transporter
MEVAGALIVVATLIMMASGRIPAILALATGLCVAGLTGIAETSDIFGGLSNGGVITVGAMLVIAKGVVATGIVSRVTWRLLAKVRSAQEAIARLMVPMGLGSALMNTTPIVAMLIPASKELEQSRRIPAREVLLPVAHITTLAGSITLIGTSSNLLIAGIAASSGVEVRMLSFAPVALPVALVGWAVIYFLAPRMLKGETATDAPPKAWRVEIPVSGAANAVGRTARTLGIAKTQDYRLMSIERWGKEVDPGTAIEAGDLLIFSATQNGVRALWSSPRFGLAPQHLYEVTVSSGEHGTLHDLEQDDDLLVIAAQTTKPLRETPALAGEVCFVTGPDPITLQDNEVVALWQSAASRTPQVSKTPVALGILAFVIVTASLGLFPIELVATAGAVAMVLTRVITPSSAARALDWNVLFILAGSVGLGNVVVASGLADVIAQAIRTLSAGSEVLVVIVFVLATALMTNLTTNAATASILTPVALVISAELGLNTVTLLAVIGTCISFTLINPFSHQSNMMVMEPGGYTKATFARFGVPLIIVSIISASVVGVLLIG